MFATTLKTLLDVMWTIGKIPCYILAAIIALFGFLCTVQYLYLFYIKGLRKKEGVHQKVKRAGLLRRVFVDAPRRVMLDYFERDPEYFRFQGLHIFCGEQGSGKSIAEVEFLMRIQEEYPRCKCITNFAYAKEQAQLTDWRQLLTYNNGIRGVVVAIDELQNWFASGKDTLPPQMLEVVTQNRKNRRIILGTSQVFTRMAKGLREQATLIYMPMTIMNCITWVRMKKPVLDHEGNVQELKSRGSYFFVHSAKIREAYDTYKVIHSLADRGFREEAPEVNVSTHTTVVTPKKHR